MNCNHRYAINVVTTMSWPEFVRNESIKSVFAVVTAIITGGGITALLASYWAGLQKRRELQLNALARFFALYGEFCSIWRIWNHAVKDDDAAGSKGELLRRAAAAEGEMEAIYLRLATEFRLTNEEQERIGCFRQGYQTL